MKIVLLGHEDAPSLFALDRLVRELRDHRFEVFVSGPLPPGARPHPALRELAEYDSRLAARILESAHPVLRAREPLPAPNSADGLERLRAAEPRLIVSIRYRRVLREDAIALPACGVLNLHSGILPEYRGVMATFWAMLAGESAIGSTLHWIKDAGLDTGPVIDVCRQARNAAASYLENVLALYGPGCDRLVQAIRAVASGRPEPGHPQPPNAGSYYSAPDAAAVAAFLEKDLKLVSGREERLLFEEKSRR